MEDRPNMLLVGMDAVRFDHLSCYGYPRKTTPNIDQIAEEGVLFENAFAAAPWTPPSFASIFTGTYPSRHGVEGANLYLNDGIPYLPEILASSGYRTLGITCPFLNRNRGFARGYQDFIEKWRWHLTRFWQINFLYNKIFSFIFNKETSEYHVDRLIKRWLSADRRKPFFIFAHYGNAHNPYRSPRTFNRKFPIPPNLNLGKLKKLADRGGGYSFIAGKISMTEQEWSAIKAWYDSAIMYIDSRLGELFSHLKKLGVFDNTVIIITSDHGENFGEHGLANHQFCLYDTLLHVPLIISYPAVLKRMRISSLVSLVDILPTLLELVEIDPVYDGFQGRSLLPLREKETYHEYVFAEYGPPITALNALKRVHPEYDASAYDRSLKCVRTKEFKYILGSDGREELYYLTQDPEESSNAINQFPDEARKLRKTLEDNLPLFRENGESPSQKEEDEATRRRLKELGYL